MQREFFGSSNGKFLMDWNRINGWMYSYSEKKEMMPSPKKEDAEKGITIPTGKMIQIPLITLFIKDSQPLNLDAQTTAEFVEFLKTRDMKIWTVNNR